MTSEYVENLNMANEYFLKMKEIVKSSAHEFPEKCESREDAEYFLKLITEAPSIHFTKHIKGKQLSKIISLLVEKYDIEILRSIDYTDVVLFTDIVIFFKKYIKFIKDVIKPYNYKDSYIFLKVVNYSDFNLIKFLDEKQLINYRYASSVHFDDILVHSIYNHDIRVLKYFVNKYKSSYDHYLPFYSFILDNCNRKIKHFKKKIEYLIERFPENTTQLVQSALCSYKLPLSLASHLVLNYTFDPSDSLILVKGHIFKNLELFERVLTLCKTEIQRKKIVIRYLETLLSNGKAPVSKEFIQTHDRFLSYFDEKFYMDCVFNYLYSENNAYNRTHPYLRESLMFLSTKLGAQPLVYHHWYKFYLNDLLLAGIYIQKPTYNVWNIDPEYYESIFKCQNAIISYKKRKYARIKRAHTKLFNEVLVPIEKTATDNQREIRKYSIPKHFTPDNFAKFLLNSDEIYITPKADGIKDKVILPQLFPYCDLKEINIFRYDAERCGNLHYIFGNMETIKQLRRTHPFIQNYNSYNYDKIYTVSGVAEISSLLKNEATVINNFISENKTEKAWWPKIVFRISNPREFDFDLLRESSQDDTDGWIVSNEKGENYKLKPDCHLTVDLKYSGKGCYSYGENNNRFPYDVKMTAPDGGAPGQIYRTYRITDKLWEAKDLREDKKQPNRSEIVQSILNYFEHPWKYSEIRDKFIPKQSYYQERTQRCLWKEEIHTPIKRVIGNSQSILNVGCGYRRFLGDTGLDHNVMVLQNSKNERSFLCDINEDWNTETQRYYGKKLGTYEYVLFLDSIHNARANLVRNIQNVATPDTKIIVRFLDNDKLRKCLEHKESISYNENYVRYTDTERTKLKIYYSHTHSVPIIEMPLSLTELRDTLGSDWDFTEIKTKRRHYSTNGRWESYLDCFNLIMFSRTGRSHHS